MVLNILLDFLGFEKQSYVKHNTRVADPIN
jgi:hypothetical protein